MDVQSAREVYMNELNNCAYAEQTSAKPSCEWMQGGQIDDKHACIS